MNPYVTGETIRLLREKNRLTQAELAEKLCVSDKAVSKWERDLSYPDVNSLPKLAEIFGMSVDELLQIKSEAMQAEEKKPISGVLSLIPRAVCLAMGVAVTVLSVLGEIDLNTAVILLGVGVACAGISLLDRD